jgi:hypothetical protein
MPEKRQRPSAFGSESGNCRLAKAAKQKFDVRVFLSRPLRGHARSHRGHAGLKAVQANKKAGNFRRRPSAYLAW